MVQYRIDATGVHLVATGMLGEHYQPTASEWGQMDDKPYYRDATVVKKTNSNEILLAMTDDYLEGWNSQDGFSDEHGPVLIMRFNATDGTLIATEEIAHGTGGLPDFGSDDGTPPPPPGTGLTGGPGGISWIDGGTKLLIQGEARNGSTNTWDYHIGIFDLINGWTDLTDQLNAEDNAPTYSYTRLSANRVSGGAAAYYLPHAGGLGRFGDLAGNPTWTPSVTTSSGTTPPAFDGFPNDGFYHPHFINAQVTKDDTHIARLTEPSCCTMWFDYLAYPGYTFTGNPTTVQWNAGANPFGNCGEVSFSSDLIVPAGWNLYINNMTLKFGPNARLILRPGAYVQGNYSTFTASDCDLRWPGIRVEGVPTNVAQDLSVQGYLRLNHCTVEEAVTGVWCRREAQPGYYGGIVRAYNSTFKDCIDGVHIEQFQRVVNNVEQDNRCAFFDTQFITTLGWPDGGANYPHKHAWLFRVNGVKFTRCSFPNDVPTVWPIISQRGWGIFSPRATFKCSGFQNYSANRFLNLTYGAFISSPDPAWAYRMEGMAFVNNGVGVYDYNGVNAVITNNKFTTLALSTNYTNSSLGLFLYQSRGYTVERNEFWDGDATAPEVPSVGVWFRGPAEMENQIYDNDFHNLNAGNVVQGDHEGSAGGQPPTLTGLQMLCNDYTGCRVDQFIMVDGHIRLRQGEQGDVEQTANNRFNNDADCTTGFETYVDPLRDVNLPNIRYKYFAGSLPVLRPECVEEIDLGPDETWIGSHYDLYGTYDPDNLDFDPEVHCNGGILDDGGGHVSDHLAAYSAKLAEYKNAVEAYNGQVDNGDKDPPLDAIGANPAWPSHQLRDLLLLNSPLSDTVMHMAIWRAVPMDPWHLTQVLIANSRISGYIWRDLDDTDVLPPFFYNLLLANQTNPSLRSVLEDEVALRSAEKSRILQRIQLGLDEDSTYVGKVDSLMMVYLADSMGTGLELAYHLAVVHGRYTEAAQIKVRLPLTQDPEVLIQLGDLEESLNGDWYAATTAQRDLLWEWAFTMDRPASADAWALLLLLGETDSLPPALLPPAYRGAVVGHNRGIYVPEPTLAAYPNPASDRLMITLPTGLDHSTLDVLDATGKLVSTTALATELPFVELNVRELPTGLYLARLTFDGLTAGECKFTIAR